MVLVQSQHQFCRSVFNLDSSVSWLQPRSSDQIIFRFLKLTHLQVAHSSPAILVLQYFDNFDNFDKFDNFDGLDSTCFSASSVSKTRYFPFGLTCQLHLLFSLFVPFFSLTCFFAVLQRILCIISD